MYNLKVRSKKPVPAVSGNSLPTNRADLCRLFTIPFSKKSDQQVTKKIASEIIHSLVDFDNSFYDALFINLSYASVMAYVDENLDYEYGSFISSCLRSLKSLYSHDISVDIGIDRERVAIDKFYESEDRCRLINEKVRRILDRGYDTLDESAYFTAVSHEISKILGPCPSLADLNMRYGSGSNTTIKKNVTASAKLGAVPVCSSNAVSSVPELYSLLPLFSYHHSGKFRVGTGELCCVPKNAKTDRVIMIEPSLNTLVQLGIGSFLKNRLSHFGVDLRDQSINQRRARTASLNGRYATVDLEAASDSIALNLVLLLLPNDWFELLNNWRTRTVSIKRDRTHVELEKFSSMGNGYTFELESIIFYAASLVACRLSNTPLDVTVYGDDIILPVGAFSTLKNIFDAFGFKLNADKSFHSGSFRESCGEDYVNGINIRPFYKRDVWTKQSIVRFHNFYESHKYFYYEGSYYDCNTRHLVWQPSYRLLKFLRSFVPFISTHTPGYGDGYLHNYLYQIDYYRNDDLWVGNTRSRGSISLSSVDRLLVFEFNSYYSFDIDVVVSRPYVSKKQYVAKEYRDRGDIMYPAYSIYCRYDVNDTMKPNEVRVRKDNKLSYPSLTLFTNKFRRIVINSPTLIN
jgi:hypothetical protein